MTVKLMAFLKAARGLSRERFVDHYETRHVPLVREIMPGIIDYRRSSISIRDREVLKEVGCGCYTEISPVEEAGMSDGKFSPRIL